MGTSRTSRSSFWPPQPCRCDLVLNHPEHPANGRRLREVSRGGGVQAVTQLLGKARVQQVHQLVVCKAPYRQCAALPVHETIAQWLEPVLDCAPPAFVLVVHARPRHPRSRDLPGQPDYSHLGESSGMLMDLDVTRGFRARIVGAEGFEPSLWTV